MRRRNFQRNYWLSRVGVLDGWGFFLHIWFLLFVFPCLLMPLFWMITMGCKNGSWTMVQRSADVTVLLLVLQAARSALAQDLCIPCYSVRHSASSLPMLLKLFSPQRLIPLPSSYNLLITASLIQVTPWLILTPPWPILMYSSQITQLLIAWAGCELSATWAHCYYKYVMAL